jgi:hypothetical protein
MLYCILNISDLNNVPYKHYVQYEMKVLQDSADTVRKNNTETEFIISFLKDSIPEIAEGNKIYNSEEINEYLNNPDNGWISEE